MDQTAAGSAGWRTAVKATAMAAATAAVVVAVVVVAAVVFDGGGGSGDKIAAGELQGW